MRIPGFTAKSSLYRTSGHYAASIGDAANTKQGIATAFSLFGPFRNPVSYYQPDVRCALACYYCGRGDCDMCVDYYYHCGDILDCNPPSECVDRIVK